MSNIFILLFFVSIIGLIAGLVQPKVFLKFTKGTVSRKKIGLIFGGLIIASLILTGVTADKTNKSYQAGYEQGVGKKAEIQKTDYKIVSYEELKTVENYWVLSESPDKSKEVVESLSRTVKKDKCKKPCNVSVYDDENAANLDIQYKKITDTAEANAWKAKNYIYVADHLLGYLEFEGDGIFMYYPDKDAYYKQLKGE